VRSTGLIAMSLEGDDQLNWAKYTDGDQDVLVVSERGQSIRFHERHVRVMGRQAQGVRAIRLHEGDLVAGMDVVGAEHTHVLVITANGYGKQTPVENYGAQGRFGLGVRTLTRDERTGPIVAMRCVNSQDGILLLTREGIVLRTQLEQIRKTDRIALGVRMMDLDDDDTIAGIAIIDASLDEAPATAGENGAAPEGDAEADVG
jgi:DNA gyrase subunit A